LGDGGKQSHEFIRIGGERGTGWDGNRKRSGSQDRARGRVILGRGRCLRFACVSKRAQDDQPGEQRHENFRTKTPHGATRFPLAGAFTMGLLAATLLRNIRTPSESAPEGHRQHASRRTLRGQASNRRVLRSSHDRCRMGTHVCGMCSHPSDWSESAPK
jgi:hypothetical protein